MATIRPNDNAPADSVKYIFPLETFDLASGGQHETDVRDTISAAAAHPWLDVEVEAAEELASDFVSGSVPYEEDVLAAPNSVAFDPEAVREALETQKQTHESPLAVEAGLDQGEAVEEGGVDLTLAANESEGDNE